MHDNDANIAYNQIMTEIWQSSAWPHFDYDPRAIEPSLAAAIAAMGEVTGLQAGLTLEDQQELQLRQLVQEAIGSFGIEGVTLDASEIEASVIASIRHRDKLAVSRRSDAIVALMTEARSATGPLTEAILWDWHRLLFFGVEVEDLGRWRRFDIEIQRSAMAGNSEVLYRAPPVARVGKEMAAFLRWFNAPTQIPLPIFAALAHLWFESIHPFSDGNGRIGRAIVEHVFARGRPLPFSLSRQIERAKKAYYAALQAGRQEGRGVIDATKFVIWFLETLAAAAESSREEARFLVQRNHFFHRFGGALNARQRSVLEKVFAHGPSRIAQGLSAKSYRRIAGTSGPTATRDLVAMEQAGVLTRSEAGGRSTVYWINL